ncbi:MAG: hypothetical protein HUJ31_08230 [Pseudomonadales bacterium]|nr:hypothetical protein [Pseudomonadales bacterium]
MPPTILAIGLQPELQDQLSTGKSEPQVVSTNSFQEALPLLTTSDVSMILIDSRSSSQLRDDVSMLLADTPVTTTIILVMHPSDLVSAEVFSALGVKTLQSPVTHEALCEAMAQV